MKLQDKTILITGASSGIGKAVALRCAQDHATIILSARNTEKLNEVKKEVDKLGGHGIVMPADVTNTEQVRALFLKATQEGGTLDVVFDNAGLGYIANIWELTTDQIKQMIDVNVTGQISVAKFASEVMVRQKHGHLIMTSSLAGLVTLPEWSVYVASKWAITAFADSIRQELAQYNIKVTTLHPGLVKTEFFNKEKADVDTTKLGKVITPEEVAEAVYDSIFTNKKRVIIPSLAKNYSLLYKFLPGLTQKLMEKMTKDIEYHNEISEDEPEFDYVKRVGE
jgi:uncharacterized protein